MNKKTLVIIGIIAVLAAAIVLQRNVHFSNVPSLKPWSGAADEIILKKGTAPEVRIVKKDGRWLIGEEAYPAEAATVSGIEKKMRDLTLSDLVTKKEFYERFDLSDDRAARVTVKGEGKVLRDILIGKRSSTGDSAYVKFADAKEVYLAGGNLAAEADRTVDSLRTHTLLTATIDTIESVSVKGRGENYTVVRQKEPVAETKDAKAKDPKAPAPAAEEKWVLSGSSMELDQNKARDFAGEFANISAQTFPVEADAKKKAVTPQREIVVKSAGKEITFKVYDKEGKDGYLCFSSENPYYAVVSNYKVDKLLKPLKDLAKGK